jgi:hypothetical protein
LVHTHPAPFRTVVLARRTTSAPNGARHGWHADASTGIHTTPRNTGSDHDRTARSAEEHRVQGTTLPRRASSRPSAPAPAALSWPRPAPARYGFRSRSVALLVAAPSACSAPERLTGPVGLASLTPLWATLPRNGLPGRRTERRLHREAPIRLTAPAPLEGTDPGSVALLLCAPARPARSVPWSAWGATSDPA